MALQERESDGVIHHSDQGTQYTSIEFGLRCKRAGIRPMGSVGDCYDNALCESFFASLECELIDRHSFRSKLQARLAVFDYIEGFDNPHRAHSSLDYLSPVNYESSALNLTRAGLDRYSTSFASHTLSYPIRGMSAFSLPRAPFWRHSR